MARKKASNGRPAPLRTMPRRVAAPGNLNETHLQRTQEAGARAAAAAAAASRPTQKRSQVAAKKSKTPKPKNPISNRKRVRPASKKEGAGGKEMKRQTLNKVKNGRVAKHASSTTSTPGGRKAEPRSSTSGYSRLTSPGSDLNSLEDTVPPRQATPQRTPSRTPKGTPKRTSEGTPEEPPNEMPVEMLSGTPSTLSRTPRPTTPTETPREPPSDVLSAVPRRLFSGTPRGTPGGALRAVPSTTRPRNTLEEMPRGFHNGTSGSTLNESPEQNSLPTVDMMNTDSPYDPTRQYEEVYDSGADIWELRRQS